MKALSEYIIKTFLLTALVLTSTSVSAQKFFHSFNSTQGLADNTVYCCRQDINGFLWLGTANGLCRFDGTSFTTYQNSPHDKSTINCNIVRDVLPVDSGLWIATDLGIDFYSLRDGIFHHSSRQGKLTSGIDIPRFNKFQKTEHHLFVVDNGGNVYRHKQGYLFETIRQNGQRYDAIAAYRDNMIVAAGPKGVYLIDEETARIIDHLPFEARITSLVNIYYSRNKSVFFVGYGIGYESHAFRVENNHLRESQAYVPPGLMATCDYGSNTVFGIDGSGLVFDNGEKLTNYTPYNSNISGDAIYSLYVDNQDNLWVGTYRMGLNLYSKQFRWFNILNRNNHHLSYDIIASVVPDGKQLYLGLDGGGLEIYHTDTFERMTFTSENSKLPGNNVISMLNDGDFIWMAVYTKGLVRYSKQTHDFKTWRMPMVEPDANNVWTICNDSLGNIWVGGPDLFVFNKQTGQISHIESVNHCMGFALQGEYMWVATRYQGLCKINRRTRQVIAVYSEKVHTPNFPKGELSLVYVDRKGQLWLGYGLGGFYRFDEKQKKVYQYGPNNGLTCDGIRSLQEDETGNMLIGTSNGLFQYVASTNTFVQLNIDDKTADFAPHSCASDGRNMYFGTTNGLIYFNPASIRTSQMVHHVSFTQFMLTNGEEMTADLYRLGTSEIQLAHNQNFFTICFSVPELVSPERIHFQCQLQGLEEDWKELGHRREVSYTNVPPGSYKLLVRTTNADGTWGEPSVLSIKVSPPWYATWWAKLLWTSLIVAVIAFLIWAYLRSLHIKHQMEMAAIETKSQRNLDEAKMNFYTSITHELRTPVFLIAAQLEEILENAQDTVKVPYTYLDAVRRNALRLNQLISRVIDFRKLGAENLDLQLSRTDVVGFCKEKTDSYTEMFKQKNIKYDFFSSVNELMLDYDVLKFELIISNLLSNAFKYTNRGGHVSLSIEDKPDRVLFSVKDNGIGIDERVRDTIFESFFRSERGRKQGDGDGLGLSYVKNLVELHHGKISVESEMGKGSVFQFFIPKQLGADQTKTQAILVEEPVHKGNPAAMHSILIVDDEQETVEVLERYLESDFKIEKAFNGEEGLQKASDLLPDIIILDLMMPRMTGLEMLTRMKRDKKMQYIKTIVFTAKASEDDMMTAFDRGADVYLTKPVSLKLLRKRIDQLLSKTAPITEPFAEHKAYSKEEQKFLLRVREVIDDNLKNPEFSIAFLAEQVGMSHSPLYKKLRQMTGMSLIEFVNDYRIYKAVQLFRQGETNVESVAEAVGINDLKNFRTLFKRKMQMTPKQFVQSLH